MALTVHHLNNSRSQRVLWLLEELGLAYEVRRYERDPRTMLAPPALKQVHPLGKSPVLEDGDDNGQRRVLIETGAIADYLVEKADGKLGPPPHRASVLLYRQFLHYAEGSLMPPLLILLVAGRVPLVGGVIAGRLRPMADVHLDFVERELAARPWFAGDEFSAADVLMSFPLEAARARGLVGGSRPATLAWLDKIHARPAYRRALDRGGAYAFA